MRTLCFSFSISVLLAANSAFAQSGKFDLQAESKKISDRNNKFHMAMRMRNNPFIVKALSMWAEKPELFGDLELVGEQKERLRNIKVKFQDAVDKIKRQKTDEAEAERFFRRKLSELKAKYHSDVTAVLLPHQIELLYNCNVGEVGLPKLVTKSLISESVGISASQKKRIAIKSDRLAAEIEEFIHKTRRKARKIVLDELTREQIKKLNEIVGEKDITRYSSMVPLQSLYKHYLISWDSSKGNPINNIFHTKNIEK